MIPPVPRHLTKRITKMGGRADNGWPLFRVMRGCEVLAFVGEEQRIKYLGTHDRYVFEMLLPCDMSESEWEEKFTFYVDGKKIHMNGPYPRNGTYELFKVIERVYMDERTKKVIRTEFVPLTSTICDALIADAIANKHCPAKYKVAAAQERRAKEEAEKEQRMIDKIDDMGLAFQGKTFVSVPSEFEIAKYS